MADFGIARPRDLLTSLPGKIEPAQAIDRVRQAENETEQQYREPGAAGAGPVSDEETIDVTVLAERIERLNREAKDYHLRYEVDKSSGQITVQIVDDDSGKVLRTVPPSAVLKLGEHRGESSGLLFSETV